MWRGQGIDRRKNSRCCVFETSSKHPLGACRGIVLSCHLLERASIFKISASAARLLGFAVKCAMIVSAKSRPSSRW